MIDWYSAHVHLHDGVGTDDLILDTIGPLLEHVTANGDAHAAYFQRHWHRGPHVRINVRADRNRWEERVRPMILERAGAHLRAHPSAGHPDREREEAQHRVLARLEREEGPLTPWEPDNTISVQPYDRRLHVLGTQGASELLAAFHSASTPLVLAALRDGRDGRSTHDLMIDLMIATMQIGCPPAVRGYLSYRSHAEGFLANCADPPAMRNRFEVIFERNRDLLRERLSEVTDTVGSQDPTHPAVSALEGWIPLARRFLVRIADLRTRGDLHLPRIPVPGELPADEGFGRLSPFHEELFGEERTRSELDGAAWFMDYRMLLNYQYLMFNRIGISPRERFLLCHLVARTVEDTFGLPPDGNLSELRQIAEERGFGPMGQAPVPPSAP